MRRSIRGTLALSGLALLSSSVVGLLQDPQEPRAQEEMSLPAFDEAGELVRPTGWEKWTLVGSSLGLGYSDRARGEGPGTFKHVYTQPEAFDHYVRTGQFPDKTVLVLAVYSSADRAAPATGGWFPDRFVAMEAAVKDVERFEGNWAYFDLGAGRREKAHAPAMPKSRCFACHDEHAAVDNVFVQFYPVLRHSREKFLQPDTPRKDG